MAINPHDDYEALAKLLYPSIEASGNVYYGQTRKLAIDELFDKNNNGFESYFCSLKNEDDSLQYEQHFHWKLGPFSDTVKIVDDNNEYKKYPLAWLKYSLAKKETEHKHVINSGEYKTYEVEYILGQPTLYCSLDGSLPNGDIYDGRSFFLDCDGDNKVLYILLYKAPVYEDMDKPLYIEALTDDVTICLIPSETEWSEEHLEQFKYKYCFENNSQPEDLTLNVEIVLGKGSRVYFKCENRPEFSNTEYLRFEITSDNPEAAVAVGGNIESMAKFEDSNMLAYAYCGLFSDNSLITDASKLYIGKLSDHGCMYLFTDCSRLSTAPVILPCLELDNYCYYSMFQECTNLNNMPILPAKTGATSCYAFVFVVTSNNEPLYRDIEIRCLLNSNDVAKSINSWLQGRAGITLYVLQGSSLNYENVLPEDCTLDEFDSITSEFYYSILVSDVPIEKYLITHGTNNSNNGRGDITDPSTLADMEKSFDENNNHPMNTYNTDDSFNQEIWGYKSFCSPVQFRNGIYTDNLAILSTYDISDGGFASDYILTGSTIKSTEIDGLGINLNYSKYPNDSESSESISFLAPLHGCKNSEKNISCHAAMSSTCDYEYENKSYTIQSSVSSDTSGSVAESLFNAVINYTGHVNAMAAVGARISSEEPSAWLSITDVRNGEVVFNSLNISRSGAKFSGDVIADNITVKEITAEKWCFSDVIAKALRGIGHTSNGTECAKYGDIGTIGLFHTTYNNQAEGTAGFIIDGENLHPVSIELEATALKAYPHMNKEMEGAWASLTPSTNDSNIILAIRIE